MNVMEYVGIALRLTVRNVSKNSPERSAMSSILAKLQIKGLQ